MKYPLSPSRIPVRVHKMNDDIEKQALGKKSKSVTFSNGRLQMQ